MIPRWKHLAISNTMVEFISQKDIIKVSFSFEHKKKSSVFPHFAQRSSSVSQGAAINAQALAPHCALHSCQGVVGAYRPALSCPDHSGRLTLANTQPAGVPPERLVGTPGWPQGSAMWGEGNHSQAIHASDGVHTNTQATASPRRLSLSGAGGGLQQPRPQRRSCLRAVLLRTPRSRLCVCVCDCACHCPSGVMCPCLCICVCVCVSGCQCAECPGSCGERECRDRGSEDGARREERERVSVGREAGRQTCPHRCVYLCVCVCVCVFACVCL